MDFGSPLVSPSTQLTHEQSRATPSSEPVSPPTASDAAKNFLHSTPLQDPSSVLFTDALVTYSDTGKELGEFTVCVERSKFQGHDCLVVHANSHGVIDSVPCGTSVVAHVTASLETLNQQHHEYVRLDSNPLHRKTFVTKDGTGLVVRRIVSQGDEVTKQQRVFTHEEIEGFVSEGANMLLQRLLVLDRSWLENDLRFLSLDSEVNLCTTSYVSLGEEEQVVGNNEQTVFGIERTIYSQHDKPTSWKAWYLPDGQLARRFQVGSPVAMKLIRMPTRSGGSGVNPMEWEKDMQVHSAYMDKKEQLKSDHASYLRAHPELRALLSDFLQFVLLRKPDETFGFAADYFSSFSPTYPDTKPGSDSSAQSASGADAST